MVAAVALVLGALNAVGCDQGEPEQLDQVEEVTDLDTVETEEAPEAELLGCPVCGQEDEEQYLACMLRCQRNGGTNAGCKRTCCKETCGSYGCYIC
jgi:hypothetical protein